MPNTTRCSFCNTIYSDFIDYSSGCPDNNGAPHAWHSTTNPSPSLPPDFPTDADMSRLLSEQDASDIASLSSNLSAEKTDRFNQSMAEMVADASGKRGIDREEFISQYKKLIGHATQHVSSGGSLSAPMFPTPPQLPPPPSPHLVYELSDGSIFQLNLENIFQNSLRSIFIPASRSLSITTVNSTEHYSRQVFEGFLLYAHDTLAWLDQLASHGVTVPVPLGPSSGVISAPATGNGLRRILAFPSMRTILEELLAAREKESSNA